MKLRLEDLEDADPGATAGPASVFLQPHLQPAIDVPAHDQGSSNSTDTSSTASSILGGCKARGRTEPTEAAAGQTEKRGAQAAATVAAPSALTVPSRRTPPVFSADVPLPRLHGMLIVRGSNLTLMGGIMELGSKEITLDDCWSLNLNKRSVRIPSALTAAVPGLKDFSP